MFGRKKKRKGKGIKPAPRGLFSESERRWGGGAGVLTGQSHLYDMDALTLRTEAARSSSALFMKWRYYLLFYTLAGNKKQRVCAQPAEACVSSSAS